jgi:FAD/FMN-containing dehydrogenase
MERGSTTPVNDVHARLNPTSVARVIRPADLDELCAIVAAARRDRRPLAVSGSRHAMGGQQFRAGAELLDMRSLNAIESLDHELGVVTAQAGVEWPELVGATHRLQREHDPAREPRWGIAQKQTGADRLTLGGALACNAHGRGLRMKPIVADVESFDLVTPDADLVRCSRDEHPDLFAHAIGGYGLFGPIARVRLRLRPRVKLRRVVRVIDIEDAVHAAQRRIDAGFLYGDFQFDIDPASPDFLTKGVFACYQPVPDDTPVPSARRELSADDWSNLLFLAHTDKHQAFQRYAQHYLSTDGQVYWSDEHQHAVYTENYHADLDRRLGATCPGSEMITELYVPPERLVDFLHAAARVLTDRRAQVIYGTIRLAMADDETVLPWARAVSACVIFNLHIDHHPHAIAHARESFGALIDLALERGGSFYLTYHRFATRDQLLAAYPRLPEFLARKHEHDPRGVFTSDWFEWLKATLGAP